jgi:uncharacterized membrane protein
MTRTRLEAFSDAVIAILMTIMVLELHPPEAGSWEALKHEMPVFLAYVLSFVNLGIYWNNHHHMFSVVERVNGKMLWANLHLLFWLSLFPFMTAWMGRTEYDSFPVLMYGAVSLLAAIGYYILQLTIIAEHGRESKLATALGRDLKGKLSPALYLSGIVLAPVNRWISVGLYVFVALMWLIPDRRVESLHAGNGQLEI